MKNLPMIVFDVNETLLDLDTMTPIFERIFHEPLAMRLRCCRCWPIRETFASRLPTRRN
jgi:hypothetical protein